MTVEKDEQLLVEELVAGNTNLRTELKIREKYLSQKVVLTKKIDYELELGRTQKQLKEVDSFLNFLENYQKEKKWKK